MALVAPLRQVIVACGPVEVPLAQVDHVTLGVDVHLGVAPVGHPTVVVDGRGAVEGPLPDLPVLVAGEEVGGLVAKAEVGGLEGDPPALGVIGEERLVDAKFLDGVLVHHLSLVHVVQLHDASNTCNSGDMKHNSHAIRSQRD